LASETGLLLLDSIRNLGSLTEEVKVFPYGARASRDSSAAAEGFVVESIVGLFKLVTQAVVGFLEVESFTFIVAMREAGKGIVGLGEAGRSLVVAGGVEAEERHSG
jgi:hypothetical protein